MLGASKNEKRMVLESHKIVDGKSIPKTKTSSMVEKLNNTGYRRKPELEIKEMTKQEARTLIMARFGMLECGSNYGGNMKKQLAFFYFVSE